jgi:hypothetical protein
VPCQGTIGDNEFLEEYSVTNNNDANDANDENDENGNNVLIQIICGDLSFSASIHRDVFNEHLCEYSDPYIELTLSPQCVNIVHKFERLLSQGFVFLSNEEKKDFKMCFNIFTHLLEILELYDFVFISSNTDNTLFETYKHYFNRDNSIALIHPCNLFRIFCENREYMRIGNFSYNQYFIENVFDYLPMDEPAKEWDPVNLLLLLVCRDNVDLRILNMMNTFEGLDRIVFDYVKADILNGNPSPLKKIKAICSLSYLYQTPLVPDFEKPSMNMSKPSDTSDRCLSIIESIFTSIPLLEGFVKRMINLSYIDEVLSIILYIDEFVLCKNALYSMIKKVWLPDGIDTGYKFKVTSKIGFIESQVSMVKSLCSSLTSFPQTMNMTLIDIEHFPCANEIIRQITSPSIYIDANLDLPMINTYILNNNIKSGLIVFDMLLNGVYDEILGRINIGTLITLPVKEEKECSLLVSKIHL